MDDGLTRIFNQNPKEALANHIVGRKIFKYGKVTSTNDMASSAATQGEEEGAVFWAREQTKGKGRFNRTWVSLKDKGLYFSLILKPEIPAKDAHNITLLTAVAIVNGLHKFCGISFSIKWPNDIVINDKKIGGILTEMHTIARGNKFIIAGIGINTNFKHSELPVKESTSLKVLLKKDSCHESLLKQCLIEIDKYYLLYKNKGASVIIDEARQLSNLWGRQVKTETLGAQTNKNHKWVIEGTAVDFDDNGALIIRQNNGFLKHIWAGEVKLLR